MAFLTNLVCGQPFIFAVVPLSKAGSDLDRRLGYVARSRRDRSCCGLLGVSIIKVLMLVHSQTEDFARLMISSPGSDVSDVDTLLQLPGLTCMMAVNVSSSGLTCV